MRAGWNADGNDLLCFTLMTVPFSFFYARSTSSGLFSLWNMQHRYEQAVTAKKAESQYTVASRTVLILRNQATEFFLCISTSRNFYRRMFPLLKNSVPHLIPPFYVTKQILVKKKERKKERRCQYVEANFNLLFITVFFLRFHHPYREGALFRRR